MNRVYGWLRQAFDQRDFVFQVTRKALANLPTMADLRPNMGPLLNQADLGSCGPNSAAEMICYDQKVEGLPVVVPSRLAIYYNTRVIMGTVSQDSGVDNRSMLKALSKSGFAPESLDPYVTSLFTRPPPSVEVSTALQNLVTDYAAVPVDLASMKAAIASGFPFLWGGEVFQGIESSHASLTGIVPDPGQFETPVGGHDIVFCGYDDNGFGKIAGGCFLFRNHWVRDDGSPWGEGGYGFMSYAYATNAALAGDFWVINSIPKGSITPSPDPSPSPPAPLPPPLPPSPPALRYPVSLPKGLPTGNHNFVVTPKGNFPCHTSAEVPPGDYVMTAGS